MSGISGSNTLEIFSNPYDLEIWVAEPEGRGRSFAFSITRGPQHLHKVIITTKPFAKTRQEVIDLVVDILESICRVMKDEFKDPYSIPSQFLNPENHQIDETKVLGPAIIARIKADLEEGHAASTYLYEKPSTVST
jgi:hypothetical protein